MSKHESIHGTKKVQYFVFRTKRRKTSEIIIDSDEIVIRVPYSKPLTEIESLIKEKISWILMKQKEISNSEKKIEISKPVYTKDSSLPYLGKDHKIQVKILDSQKENNRNVEKNSVKYKNEVFVFKVHPSIQGNQDSIDEIKLLYENWLYHKANIIFKEKVHILSRAIGVKANKVVIKNLKNRWASITKTNEINLNINLIKAPPEIIEYIIIHELCHIKIKGHSYNFWNLLRRYYPDYPKSVEWLNTNGKNLLS
ncbi:MAG TPA: YgjP-like metallopeptidase domain-containing protein [Nitrososphaeraceae archaeon]|nr:YgjP-like metallopeptidase domain-containing protein [Nitrososphaeraceae archaeon]